MLAPASRAPGRTRIQLLAPASTSDSASARLHLGLGLRPPPAPRPPRARPSPVPAPPPASYSCLGSHSSSTTQTGWAVRSYHGDPKGNDAQVEAFNQGIRAGAFGLLLNSIVLAFNSFLIEPMCKRLGPRIVWVSGNFFVCIAMAATALISFWSLKDFHGSIQQAITANKDIKAVSLVLFAFLGVPLACSFRSGSTISS